MSEMIKKLKDDPLYDENIQTKIINPSLEQLLIERLDPPVVILITDSSQITWNYCVPSKKIEPWQKLFLESMSTDDLVIIEDF